MLNTLKPDMFGEFCNITCVSKILPSHLKNEEKIEEILCGTWPTTTPSNLQMATANRSCGLLSSILH